MNIVLLKSWIFGGYQHAFYYNTNISTTNPNQQYVLSSLSGCGFYTGSGSPFYPSRNCTVTANYTLVTTKIYNAKGK